jgi:hypothetical protein
MNTRIAHDSLSRIDEMLPGTRAAKLPGRISKDPFAKIVDTQNLK